MSDFTYLGDGVYARFDGFGVWLHANHHEYPTDKIYLEPSVLQDLTTYVDIKREELKNAQRTDSTET